MHEVSSVANSFRDIIDKWEHTSTFAADVGVPYERAKAWWRRDRIPGAYFVAVVSAAQRNGFSDVTERALSAIAARSVQAASKPVPVAA